MNQNHPESPERLSPSLSPDKSENPENKGEIPVRSLIRQAQEGSQEAYCTLRLRYRPLLEASVSRFSGNMTMQELADMREEADRVFLAALSSYDTAQEAVDFGLYAKICLHNGLVSEWRHLQVLRKCTPVPLSDTHTVSEDDPERRFVEAENFLRLSRSVSGYLSDFENQVWWQYVTGVSVASIASGLGRDEKSIHNAIYRIRRKLRARLSPPDK